MASKRRNMFHQNKKKETTEIGLLKVDLHDRFGAECLQCYFEFYYRVHKQVALFGSNLAGLPTEIAPVSVVPILTVGRKAGDRVAVGRQIPIGLLSSDRKNVSSAIVSLELASRSQFGDYSSTRHQAVKFFNFSRRRKGQHSRLWFLGKSKLSSKRSLGAASNYSIRRSRAEKVCKAFDVFDWLGSRPTYQSDADRAVEIGFLIIRPEFETGRVRMLRLSIFLLALVSLVMANAGRFKSCGERLSYDLMLACPDGFAGRKKSDPNMGLNEVQGYDSDDFYSYILKHKPYSLSLHKMLRSRRGGVVDECCRRSCSLSQLRQPKQLLTTPLPQAYRARLKRIEGVLETGYGVSLWFRLTADDLVWSSSPFTKKLLDFLPLCTFGAFTVDRKS
ncbi:hypothetical protein AAG570_008609 [Ranatra chinensis]|uniref:Insulin-like domain-containing protein n=1 Tax=Ranatra chinensis TaxID=642074 RepID=A0ABD0YS08_9HEMI